MNLQAVQQPALGLVALTGSVHRAAQNRLQVTELKNENKKYISKAKLFILKLYKTLEINQNTLVGAQLHLTWTNKNRKQEITWLLCQS